MVAAAVSWILGFALLAAPTLGLAGLGDLPRSATLLLIWMSLAGLPRPRSSSTAKPGARLQPGLCTSLALMGPLLCLAGVLDRRAGIESGPLYLTLGFGAGFALLLQWAAQRARLSPQAHLRHGWAWFLCVLLISALGAVLGWDGAPGGGPQWWATVANASPLEWIYGRALDRDFSWPILPALLTVALVGLAFSAPVEPAGSPAEPQA